MIVLKEITFELSMLCDCMVQIDFEYVLVQFAHSGGYKYLVRPGRHTHLRRPSERRANVPLRWRNISTEGSNEYKYYLIMSKYVTRDKDGKMDHIF